MISERVARKIPRLVIAGLGGDSGKTLLSATVLAAARRMGLDARAFKKGPDYIDAAWLTWASARAARNLDAFMMPAEAMLASFGRHSSESGINVIEGNRGLYDGSDSRGSCSTAELAKLLDAPVILAVNAAKVTRTVAACVLGCQNLDPGVRIAGVVLNRISNARHERVVRESIESACGIPVLGALPRMSCDNILPGRHLGLVTPQEHPHSEEIENALETQVEKYLDIEALLRIARAAGPLSVPVPTESRKIAGGDVRIGYVLDSAFTFYYPENLEALQAEGATLVAVSSLSCGRVPDGLDALYIGGGFPETHAARISGNRVFLESLCDQAHAGLPIYAECGGLMLLSCGIRWQGRDYRMAGVLPFSIEVCDTPQGHGYAVLGVDTPNPFLPEGLAVRGHEFHYSRIALPDQRPHQSETERPRTACAVKRGNGCYDARDGVIAGNTWASYTHVHALATPEWAAGLVAAARRYRSARAAAR